MNQRMVAGLIGLGVGAYFLLFGDDKKEDTKTIENNSEDEETEITEKTVNYFSARSKAILASCDSRLQLLFNEVLKEHDCTIVEGYRNEANQELMYEAGKTQLHYPNSKHNNSPSLAVDVAPYDKNLKKAVWDVGSFMVFAETVKRVAQELDIPVAWGGDWESFVDMPHWEIIS